MDTYAFERLLNPEWVEKGTNHRERECIKIGTSSFSGNKHLLQLGDVVSSPTFKVQYFEVGV